MNKELAQAYLRYYEMLGDKTQAEIYRKIAQ